jgi:undecaprenyl pyrophosphate phosphatase UppP
MSILTAIVQAILQAVTWILPISESGHSSIFHDFAGRVSDSCAAITGVIHIGIAIGIVICLYDFNFVCTNAFVAYTCRQWQSYL